MNTIVEKTKPSSYPWRVLAEYESGRLQNWHIVDSDDSLIAIVPRFAANIDCPTQEANAELIVRACNAIMKLEDR
jgi:hypothetical protein